MKVKELICWFKILYSERETRKRKICIVYSKSAWKRHCGQPCSLATVRLSLKYFHFYLSDAAPVFPKSYHLQFLDTLTWPFVQSHQSSWELPMPLAHGVPRRGYRKPPSVSWISSPQHFLVTRPVNVLTLFWVPLWQCWPYSQAAAEECHIKLRKMWLDLKCQVLP